MKKYIVLVVLSAMAFLAKGQSNTIAIAKIKGETYKAVYNDNRALSIFNHKGKTIFFLKSKELYNQGVWEVKFEDFDGDGYQDLIITYTSNTPYEQDLILFAQKLRKFILVKNFPDYPASIRLRGTGLFYSYHHSGCADVNWDSDLFKIQNFKIVKLGNISLQACSDEKPLINITKFIRKHKLLVKNYPITEMGNFKDKRSFIAWYWKNHYKKFTASY